MDDDISIIVNGTLRESFETEKCRQKDAEGLKLVRQLQSWRPALQKLLKFIIIEKRALELQDDVEEIRYLLDLTKMGCLDIDTSVETVRCCIERTQEMVFKYTLPKDWESFCQKAKIDPYNDCEAHAITEENGHVLGYRLQNVIKTQSSWRPDWDGAKPNSQKEQAYFERRGTTPLFPTSANPGQILKGSNSASEKLKGMPDWWYDSPSAGKDPNVVPNPRYVPSPQQQRPEYVHRESSHRPGSSQRRAGDTLGHAMTSARRNPEKTRKSKPAPQAPKNKVYRVRDRELRANANARSAKETKQVKYEYELIVIE